MRAPSIGVPAPTVPESDANPQAALASLFWWGKPERHLLAYAGDPGAKADPLAPLVVPARRFAPPHDDGRIQGGRGVGNPSERGLGVRASTQGEEI